MSTEEEIAKFKGYVPLEEYKRRKEELQHDLTLRSVQDNAALPAVSSTAPEDRAASKKKRKAKASKGAVSLSFEDGDGDEEVEAPTTKRVHKAPGVEASFLGMNAAEREDQAKVRERKMMEVLERQRAAKQEEVEVRYTFRNEKAKKLLGNQFYKGAVRCRRGDNVATVLEAIHAKLSADHAETISSQLLLVAANDYLHLIMQPHMTLLDIGALKWREGGLMFDLGANPIHVAERAFFEQNKHLHPMVLWKLHDGFTTYSEDETIRNRGKAQTAGLSASTTALTAATSSRK
eukprot:CAMPEP_0206044232 /NCGR_PEP_ID=MMETSP1466-20131121/11987_1 /ASSEMBLY_ACC=CAM_ASM_001126 /TAXON_ID=44452 /ORGANISM="Pavlova gyrans, Strain CCMP608" /LENGTH=290 /DNA_ID=CAMNT_0053419117 /DNA_START=18 /DNA_END=890 /DNA_ORIENTATION=-